MEIFWDFTDQHLNLSFFAKLCYLQEIYKNPTFRRYTALRNLHGQVLQTHWLTLLLNNVRSLFVSCVLVGVTIIAENGNLLFLNQYIQFFLCLKPLKIFGVVSDISLFKHRFHNRRSKTIFYFEISIKRVWMFLWWLHRSLFFLQQCFEVTRMVIYSQYSLMHFFLCCLMFWSRTRGR